MSSRISTGMLWKMTENDFQARRGVRLAGFHKIGGMRRKFGGKRKGSLYLLSSSNHHDGMVFSSCELCFVKFYPL